jgi:site-specific DNA recombinase
VLSSIEFFLRLAQTLPACKQGVWQLAREKGIDPDKVAIYIRWSTDDQADGTTLEVQSEGCRHYLLSQGWVPNEDLIFVDDGWSGGNLNRPAMGRLRALVRTGQVDCVVVFKLDRLSRSVIDMVNLVLEEWDGLTYVKSAREPMDTSSAMGKQFFYMLVSFAEWERNVIRERTSAGRQARAKEGYKPSAVAAYGYRHGERTGAYAVVETEAALVQRMFELYVQGLGTKAIVNKLNGEGLRNRGGELWNIRTVTYMLSNPLYTGKMVYGQKSRNPRYGKASGESYWLKNEKVTVVEDSPFIPAIVSEDVYALVQQLKSGRTIKPNEDAPSLRALGSPYLVTGLAKCKCGSSLYARFSKKDGREYHYYACMGRKTKGAAFCDAAPIPRDVLDKQVEREILARYGDRVARERFRESLEANLVAQFREVGAASAQVDERIARLEAQEKQVRSDYREQVITASEFRALRKDLMDELHEVRAQRQQLAARRVEIEEQQQALSARLQAVEQMDRWGELAPNEQKMLLHCFVSSMNITATPIKKEIHLNIAWY